MRTNIEIDDDLMDKAMSAGPYKTKKDAVEAGLKLLARQAAYREILKWEGKLKWDGEPWGEPAASAAAVLTTGDDKQAKPPSVQEPKPGKRGHAGR